MANIRTHYDNLKVARNAPDSVIKAAYKALCQTYHPDKFQGSTEKAERIMKIINASYKILIDPVKREVHDAWIREKEAETKQPSENTQFGETGKATDQQYDQKQDTKQEYTPPPNYDLNPSPINSAKWGSNVVILMCFIFVLLFLSQEKTETPRQVQIQYANDLYNQGRYEESLPLFQQLAEQGNAAAENNLGVMYHNGQGVQQDYQQALLWYRKAVMQGYAQAEANLGRMYDNGQGVKQDYQQALQWYRKAADQGNAQAGYSLGWMYHNGQGVKQDYQQAAQWYRKAAEQGDATAQNNLGDMYENGQGVAQDYTQALIWYRKAAEQKEAIAQYSLGLMYSKGRGVAQDNNQAVAWYRKAAEQGQENAITALKELGQ